MSYPRRRTVSQPSANEQRPLLDVGGTQTRAHYDEDRAIYSAPGRSDLSNYDLRTSNYGIPRSGGSQPWTPHVGHDQLGPPSNDTLQPHRLVRYTARNPLVRLDISPDGRPDREFWYAVHNAGHESAFSRDVHRLILVSEDIPWRLEIIRGPGAACITVNQILSSVRSLTTTPITWSELLLAHQSKRQAVYRAGRSRANVPSQLFRYLWLEENTCFLGASSWHRMLMLSICSGILKDDRIAKGILDPFYDPNVETWIMVFGRPQI